MKSALRYFSRFELCLWLFSVVFIISSFFAFQSTNYPSLIASLIGVTALIFCAKGNPLGQVLIIIFSLFYGYISFTFAYYGEMMTYVGMSAPMAVVAFVSWVKHPYKNRRSEVHIRKVTTRDLITIALLTSAVTLVFYFILKLLGTSNLPFSTISITTSFIAVYLTYLRSPFYALAYALNDVVLIIMWSLAAAVDISYLSVIICFIVFLVNDLYGFYSWLKRKKRQESEARTPVE